jgi:PRC-barrel domain
MTLPTIDQARSWRGLTLVAADNEPVGRIEAIYVDRTTRQPEWALVDTGLFGSARTFVPLADAAQRGDVVRVPHETSTVRGAPRLDQDAELSEEDEARLYAHYGIQYTTEQSPSGLPAGATTSPDGGTAAAATDATAELGQPPTRLQADAPTTAGTAAGTTPTAASVPGDGDASGTGGGRRKQAAAGIGAVALAAIAAGLAELRRRRRRPPSLGERVGQVSREAVDALTQAAEQLRRQAVAAASGEGARKAAKSGRRATRKASRAGQEAAGAGRRAAQVAVASGLAAAESSRRAARKAARKAAKTGHEASEESRRAARKAAGKAAKTGHEAAEGGRRAARKAAASGAAAAAEGRRAAKRASKEAAAVVAAIETTPESKRKARKRAQARKRAAAATAAAARSVAAAPAAAGRRVQKLDAGQRTRKVIPRRRRRSKMKMMGKLGMVVGAAVGYVLGARAGRERYDQLTASARQLLDKPQVKRVVESAPGDLGARLEQAANKAADKVHEAGDKVASSGSETPGSTTGATTTSATTSGATTTTTTPTAPSTVGGATTKRSPAASERKTKSS